MNQIRSFLLLLVSASFALSGCTLKEKLVAPTPTNVSPTETAQPTPVNTATPVATTLLRDAIGEKMIVATSADFPPYESLDAQNNVVGFDIDLIREIGMRGGVEVEIQNLGDFNALIPALTSGSAHVVIAGMRPNAERRQQVDFTQYYHLIPQSIVTAPDIPVKIESIEEIIQYNLGVAKDTPADQWIIYDLVQSGKLPIANLNRYDSDLDVVQALKAGQVVVGLLDSRLALDRTNNGELKTLLTSQIVDDGQAIAVNKGQTALLDGLNMILSMLQAEGTIGRLEEVYFKR